MARSWPPLRLAARRQDRPAGHRAHHCRARPLHLAAAAGPARRLRLAQAGGQRLRKWVSFEFVLALGIVLLATIVANTVPAKHALIQNWPYSFRFSLAATWGDQRSCCASGAVLRSCCCQAWPSPWAASKNGTASAASASPRCCWPLAAGVGLPPLAIDAYPETYRKTPVPFDTISIANGSALFAENCVACHGAAGQGRWRHGQELPKPPVDMLTEPHTAKHTAGDFFHWLTFGIPDTGMPVFADKLSEEDRWDVVNYLHAMSRGYQARLMSPSVKPDQPQPSMGPPNFSYVAQDGSSGTLKDFRGQKNVLLVLFSWPQSRERLAQLATLYPELARANTVLLAVPEDDPDRAGIGRRSQAEVPFPVVTEGAHEIGAKL